MANLPIMFAALDDPGESISVAEGLDDRRTPELVFAFIGPIASGVSTTVQVMRSILIDTYVYEVPEPIKISDLIKESAHFVGREKGDELVGAARITHLQDVGNDLREKFGSDYLARKCVDKIAQSRHDRGYKKVEVAGGEQREVPEAKRCAHFIDSIKNPAELDLLKTVYGDMFWVIGVFAPENVREKRLISKGLTPPEASKIMTRDQGEDFSTGQSVRKTFSESDLFVRNDKDTQTRLEKTVARFLEIIFFAGIHTPNRHESAMYEAAAVAGKSACMSRQVGAAIVDKDGEILGVGWNDVPKFGGGLYSEDD